jgi:hypothetical protein
VHDLVALTELLQENGVAAREVGSRLIVDPAPGQGAIYCFEEIR